jgi:hypothetical protein
MQGVTPPSVGLAQLPPHRLDTVGHNDDATPSHKLELGLDGPAYSHSRSAEGDIEMGLCDSAPQIQEGHIEEAGQATYTGHVISPNDTSASDVNFVTEEDNVRQVPADQGGLPQAVFGLLPNEILFHILSFLDVYDLLSTSRVSSSFHCVNSASLPPPRSLVIFVDASMSCLI